MPNRTWKTIRSKLVYSNPWIRIHEDQVTKPDGAPGIYGYLDKPPGIFIIARDADGSIYLINEYRYVLKQSLWQLPTGVVEGDDLSEQAQKELLEETGIRAAKWQCLGGFFVAPGHETTYEHVYLATELDISHLNTDAQESDESILEIKRISIRDLKLMIVRGEIKCGLTLAALNLFFLQ